MGLPIDKFYEMLEKIDALAIGYGMEVGHFIGGENVEITLKPITNVNLTTDDSAQNTNVKNKGET